MVTKLKVGRKLTGESWTQRVRKEVLQWFNTPKDQRQMLFGARTDEEFAEQLGMHRNTLYNLRQQAVDGIPNRFWGTRVEREELIPLRYDKPLTTQPVTLPRPKETPPVTPPAQIEWWRRKHWRSEEEIDSALLTYEQKTLAKVELRNHPEWATETNEEPYGHGRNCTCAACRIQKIVREARQSEQRVAPSL